MSKKLMVWTFIRTKMNNAFYNLEFILLPTIKYTMKCEI